MGTLLRRANFSLWLKAFALEMNSSYGLSVTLRDGAALQYRNLYDRGHTPQRAARLMK